MIGPDGCCSVERRNLPRTLPRDGEVDLGRDGRARQASVSSVWAGTFRQPADCVVAIQGRFTKRKHVAIRPPYLHALHPGGFTQTEVERVCVLRAMGIARHNLPNRTPAVVTERHADADR